MRSMLFVPGDSARKFESALCTAADSLIIDLEDSVAQGRKAQARQDTLEMLRAPQPHAKVLFVRVNALDSGMALADLAAIMPGRPYGVVLPKCQSADDVKKLSLYLDAFEAVSGAPNGSTRILAIATETAQSLFGLGTYTAAGPRLWGLMWGAEDLSASLGASTNRKEGRWLDPYLMARSLCLAGAAAAGVAVIDTVETDIGDLDRVRLASVDARRDGFSGKAVIHPKHVDVVNETFSLTEEERAWAQRVVAAFAADPDAGVVRLGDMMIDKPHLRAAQRMLGIHAAAGSEVRRQ
ncbi:CoA ester lyase [Xanthobacter sp. DSM 24535]|uniref:HpcH/HpaI aldolase/citrate lyase family protein n=1 Tax=Roseixanthobacter psychrophilus TaxID=3119917 RepID=UPI00372C1A85